MIRPRISPVGRLLATPPNEIRDLLVAQAHLLAAWWTVRRRPKGGLLHLICAQPLEVHPSKEERLASLAVAVDRVARFGVFRPTCLVRAVALERLIRRAHAGPAVVRVGVLRTADEFSAHAWIELDGRVIGDEPANIRRFTPLHEFSALAR